MKVNNYHWLYESFGNLNETMAHRKDSIKVAADVALIIQFIYYQLLNWLIICFPATQLSLDISPLFSLSSIGNYQIRYV